MAIRANTNPVLLNNLPAGQEILNGTLRTVGTHGNYIRITPIKYLSESITKTFAKCKTLLLRFIYQVKWDTGSLYRVKRLFV